MKLFTVIGLILFVNVYALVLTPRMRSDVPEWSADSDDGAPQIVEVIKTEFGLFTGNESDGYSFKPAAVITNDVRVSYGWRIKVKTSSQWVRVREEFILPKKPETWGGPSRPDRLIVDDGRTCISTLKLPVIGGMISQVWGFAPGDPNGVCQFKVYVDDKLIGDFKFEVK